MADHEKTKTETRRWSEAWRKERQRAEKAERALAALERQVVANAGRHSREGRLVRWGHVAEAVGIGSTRATEMCQRAGYDPCEQVGTEDQQKGLDHERLDQKGPTTAAGPQI